MFKELLDLLIDPISKENLSLKIFLQTQNTIQEGFLYQNNNWYPVINGIPRMFTGQLRKEFFLHYPDFFEKYKKDLPEIAFQEKKLLLGEKITDQHHQHQLKTKKSFSYEWQELYKENDFEMQNFIHFIKPVNKDDFQDKVCLDVGCGSGRFTKMAAMCGAKMVIGCDLGESVETAREMTKSFNNVQIVQADIYSLPFKESVDLAFAIGVLHHLPSPQQGFNGILATLKPKGEIIIWVYDKKNNKRAIYLYEPLRKITTKIPKPVLKPFCHIPAAMVQILNWLYVGLKNIKLNKIAEFIPFRYYSNFSYNMKFNDSFDVLATPKSNYYTLEDIEKWFKDAGLKIKDIHYVKETGITCLGQKL